ncbi:MAG TPA: DUF6491 family protein [Steroidobacteraceae bacterium]|nr:DUF6491 family protein [Steroidobacteraceae bacterium]
MRRADPRLVASSWLAVMVLAGCSSGGIPKREDEAQVRARFAAYAGEPIDRMTWMGQYYSWEPVGENQLVVFTTPSDAYLLKVSGPCTDLKFVTSIGLTSTGSTVYSRLDSVKVRHWRCPIAEIRKVDYKRMRADMRAEAEKARPAS